MPPNKKQMIEMTPDELDREREAAATKALRAFVEEEVQPVMNRLRADLRQVAIARDLIPEDVLLGWLGVSKQTLRYDWGVPHCTKQGNTRFYDWDTVEAYLRDGNEEQQEALSKAQNTSR
jgi:hypothetical protein